MEKNRVGKAKSAPDWWLAVPAEEQMVLREVMRMVRGLKRSSVPQVARAARTWESGFGFFIRVRLQNAKRRKQGAARGEQGALEAN